ncbi:juvenile hormone esterase-like [Rhodnius prolixus]|uniref:juvenile hormone esterase-like n=1 Tax=Rhodnius prolixus TaxID=13249 RepID=UPI003D189039
MLEIDTVVGSTLLVQFSLCTELIVNTTCGTLIGREFKSRNGRTVAAFNGIPFAKPPLGKLRFQDPQPSEPWIGVREAYNFGSVCVQIPYGYPPVNTTKMGNEDCLYLSVCSPNLNPTSQLPVLVYFHGGPFYSGSGEVDKSPEYVLDYDLVVVMPNFRLGVLVFLTMEDDIMPGNIALKDQVMALVWIQNNIANFGGDPNQVTLLGDTAGAASVSYHMYSPMSRGLFHRAISQSGTALSPWANVPLGIARRRAIKMAQLFHCPTESSQLILDCLGTKNAYELTESYFLIFRIDPFIIFNGIFDINAANPFLPFNPHDAEPAPIPWIAGITSLEGLIRTAVFVREPETLIVYDRNFDQIAPVSLFYDNTAPNPEEVTKEIREYYFDGQPITMSLFQNLTDLYSDRMLIWPVIETLQKHSDPHYLYYFDYLGEYSYQEIFAGRRVLQGSADIDDTIYIWNIKNPFVVGVPTSTQDLYISNLLVKLFYNFASSGEPTSSGIDFNWPQWDCKQQNFINIANNGVTLDSSLLQNRMQFWAQLTFRDNVDGN